MERWCPGEIPDSHRLVGRARRPVACRPDQKADRLHALRMAPKRPEQGSVGRTVWMAMFIPSITARDFPSGESANAARLVGRVRRWESTNSPSMIRSHESRCTRPRLHAEEAAIGAEVRAAATPASVASRPNRSRAPDRASKTCTVARPFAAHGDH